MKGPLQKPEKEVTACEQEARKPRRGKMCNHTTFEEAKNSCLARKRKERQESISSISQERKVIRSSSEERPVRSCSRGEMKRVSSLEDVKKKEEEEKKESFYSSFEGGRDCSPNRDYSVQQLYEDYDENEKRRSHERFARPLAQGGRRNNAGKKPKTRQFSKIKYKSEAGYHLKHHSPVKHSEEKQTNLDSFLRLHTDERQRTPSPEPVLPSPTIDLTTLHEQIDCTEPIPSITTRPITDETETLPSALVASNRLLLSPRNSIIMSHRIYLDPDVPQTNSSLKKCKNPIEQRMKDLTKQINNLKRKIKKLEEEFEGRFGYKPSHADKMNDKSMRQLYAELNQVRKHQKQLKEDCPPGAFDGSVESVVKVEVKLHDTLIEIEKRLGSKQFPPLEQMNSDQLLEEKIAMQKALLYLESLHGRPTSKDDRDLVRPLYDKYRSLKRLISKNALSSGSGNELQTIHEDETMDFVSSPPTLLGETDSEKTPLTTTSTDSDTDTSIGENLHSLGREELAEHQRMAAEEKKRLRRCLKQFEADVETRTGRKVQKDDKLPMEGVYVAYKKTKAKLRLLDALLNKQ